MSNLGEMRLETLHKRQLLCSNWAGVSTHGETWIFILLCTGQILVSRFLITASYLHRYMWCLYYTTQTAAAFKYEKNEAAVAYWGLGTMNTALQKRFIHLISRNGRRERQQHVWAPCPLTLHYQASLPIKLPSQLSNRPALHPVWKTQLKGKCKSISSKKYKSKSTGLFDLRAT